MTIGQIPSQALDGYKPISAYGVIGNLRSVALVGFDGSIDWCCFPHMDRPSVFAALLDTNRGGRFQITLADTGPGTQEYAEDSNVLRTRFDTESGALLVTDFMPLSGNIHGCGESVAPAEIHRLIECERGKVDVRVTWSPRFDYARAPAEVFRRADGWVAKTASDCLTLAGLEEGEIRSTPHGVEVAAAFQLHAGERRALVTRWGSEETRYDVEESFAAKDRTVAIWREWAHREGRVSRREWAGEFGPLVTRSALVFKLLSHADTGAIAAAPTTSLPETVGGSRNWDYRYAWIRDASLTAQALVSMGHNDEALELLHWMERTSEKSFDEKLRLQIMYGLHGETEIAETELPHLEGYRRSSPVRIGNEAAEQFQLEIFGELLNTGYELVRRGEALSPHLWTFLRRVTNHVVEVWKEPDYGIWEIRGPPRHFTYSKVMAWVAFDRAIHLCDRYGLEGEVPTWRRARQEVRDQVLKLGYDDELGSFVLAYGCKDLDAANLRIPMLEFLPFDDPRVQGTIERTLEHLTVDGFVYRYRFDDGLHGDEGAFGLCSFWLVDALALSNRTGEARALLEKAAGLASPLGLFPEQFDPESGAFLGNFPQAFTHIGLINSALHLAYAEGREVPEHAPIGTPTHRREKAGKKRPPPADLEKRPPTSEREL